jgi:gliding motility-associated-like protein
VTPQSVPNYTYQWDAAAGNQTDSTAIDLAAGTYTVTITDGNGCVKDTTFDLIAVPIPLFDSFTDQEECESYFLPEITGSTLSGNEAYYMQSGGVGTALIQGDAITATQTVFVYDIIGTCSEEVSFVVTIHDLPEVIGFTGEGTYCEGDIPQNLNVEIEGEADYTLEYTLDGVSMSISSTIETINLGNAPGMYVITGIQDNYCSNTSNLTQTIIVHLLPSAPVVTGDTEFCTNEQILPLMAQGNSGSFTWYADQDLLQVISTEDQFTPENMVGITSYYVTATENDCEGAPQMISIEVMVCDVIIPTAFTPDNDDVNDTWNIVNLDMVYPNNEVTVFNRFGNKIYGSIKGQYNEMPWDGTHENNPLPVASYFYLIEYNDESTTNSSGTVTIVK